MVDSLLDQNTPSTVTTITSPTEKEIQRPENPAHFQNESIEQGQNLSEPEQSGSLEPICIYEDESESSLSEDFEPKSKSSKKKCRSKRPSKHPTVDSAPQSTSSSEVMVRL